MGTEEGGSEGGMRSALSARVVPTYPARCRMGLAGVGLCRPTISQSLDSCHPTVLHLEHTICSR